jgi:hypothetical protein
MAAIFNNEGVSLGVDASLESLLEVEENFTDMSRAQEGWNIVRRRRKT